MPSVTLYTNCGCFNAETEVDQITQSFIDDMANCKTYFSGCEAEAYNNLVKKLKTVVFAADSTSFPATGVANTLYVDVENLVLYVWKTDSYFAFSNGSGSIAYVADQASLPVTGQSNFLYIIKSGFKQAIWNGTTYDISSQYTAAEKTKLSGIQAEATKNESDATTRAYIDNADEDTLNSANEFTTSAAATAQANAEAYADSIVTGLWDDRGNYNASGNTFPATGGSGTAGAIKKGDIWTISVAGTLGGSAVEVGDAVRALADTPGQTAGNWAIAENNRGYVAENQANKVTNLDSPNDIDYPTTQAVATAIANSSGGGIAGNLVLNKTSGGQIGFNVPNGYTYADLEQLYNDVVDGTITIAAETFTAAPIPYPAGWGDWRPTTPLQYPDGSIGYTMTPDEFRGRYMTRGQRYYVAPYYKGGSVSNDGLTADSPMIMGQALGISDAVEIIAEDGYYDVTEWSGIGRSISIRCLNGRAVMGGVRFQDTFRYLTPSGTPDIYNNPSGAGNGIVLMNEFDPFGKPVIMKQVGSETEMQAQENTYYVVPYPGSGCKFHFRSGFTPVLLGAPSGTPNCFMLEPTTANLMDMVSTPSETNIHIYMEGCDIYCQGLSRVTSNCEFYAQNCSFQGAQVLGDELTFSNAILGGAGNKAIFFECHSGYCALDAYSYTGFQWAEIGCTGGLSSLYSTTASNQVSTSHSGSIGVRIKCDYSYSSYGTTDVTGSKTFNVGVTLQNINNTPITAWDDHAEVYCIKCSSPDAVDGVVCGARSTATCYVQAPKEPVTANPETGGTIKYYGIYQ